MTPEEFKKEMERIAEDSDTELSHRVADIVMGEVLSELGYSEGVEIFENMNKWYA